MANILQLNSRKGLVQLSQEDLVELDLLRWIRQSFRGIGRDGFIEVTPFESAAAEMYVQKYPDCQVDLATKCTLEPSGGVSVILRTFSEPKDRYYNVADNDTTFSSGATNILTPLANTSKKKSYDVNKLFKFSIYTGSVAGGQVIPLTEGTSSENGVTYKTPNGEVLTIPTNTDGSYLIQGWPDVKGVDIYPKDPVLLISDFSGFVGSSAMRAPEMPKYNELVKNPEVSFYKNSPKSNSAFNDFDKTMILLGLTARRVKDVDLNKIYIDQETWDGKYRDIIGSKLNIPSSKYVSKLEEEYSRKKKDPNASPDELNNLAATLSTAQQSISNSPFKSYDDFAQYITKKQWGEDTDISLDSETTEDLINSIDIRDAYIYHAPSVDVQKEQKKDSKNVKFIKTRTLNPPSYLIDAISHLFNTSPQSSSYNLEELLKEIQPKFSEINLLDNYKDVLSFVQQDMLRKELMFILDKVSTTYKQVNPSVDLKNIINSNELDEVDVAKDYTTDILANYPNLSATSSMVQTYNKALNYLHSLGLISTFDDISPLSLKFVENFIDPRNPISLIARFDKIDKNNVTSSAGLTRLQAILDFIINYGTIQKQEISKDTSVSDAKIHFANAPITFMKEYITNFENTYTSEKPKPFINYKAIPKAIKEDALASIGYSKNPLTHEEFLTKCPDARSYENLWITNWNDAPAEEKAERLSQAFGLDRDVNPDFKTTLFTDPKAGLTGLDPFKEQALLDYHKYKIEKDGLDAPLHLVAADKDDADKYKEAKQEFSVWMKDYVANHKQQSSSAAEELHKAIEERDKAKQQLRGLRATDPNYETRATELEEVLDFYTDKVQTLSSTTSLDNLAHSSDVPSWDEYVKYFMQEPESAANASEGFKGRESNETRQVVVVEGFTFFEDVSAPDNLHKIKEYVISEIEDSTGLNRKDNSAELTSKVNEEIGHLYLPSITDYLRSTIKNDIASSPADSSTVEAPLSYEGFRSTIRRLYEKLGIADPAILTPKTLLAQVDAGKSSGLITRQEAPYLTSFVNAINKYISYVEQEYADELDAIDAEINKQSDAADDPNASAALEMLLEQKVEIESYLNKIPELYSYLFSTIPDEIISQYGLLSIDQNLTKSDISGEGVFENISEKRLPSSKSASMSPEEIYSTYKNYMLSPEVIQYIKEEESKLKGGSSYLGTKADLTEVINNLAPIVQKEFINQYVEQHPELFGKDFLESTDFDATESHQDIWAVVRCVNPTYNTSSSLKSGLYLVTPDQLLKVDSKTIDLMYSNEVRNINKDNKEFSPSTFTPYFIDDAKANNKVPGRDRASFEKNSYLPAIEEYQQTENYLKQQDSKIDTKSTLIDNTTEYLPQDKYKSGPIDNYKLQHRQISNMLKELPDLSKEKSRLALVEEQLNDSSLSADQRNPLIREKEYLSNLLETADKEHKSLSKKLQKIEDNIHSYTPTYTLNHLIEEKTKKLSKDKQDLVKFKEDLSKLPPEQTERINKLKEIIKKRENMIEIQEKHIQELRDKEPNNPITTSTSLKGVEGDEAEQLLARRDLYYSDKDDATKNPYKFLEEKSNDELSSERAHKEKSQKSRDANLSYDQTFVAKLGQGVQVKPLVAHVDKVKALRKAYWLNNGLCLCDAQQIQEDTSLVDVSFQILNDAVDLIVNESSNSLLDVVDDIVDMISLDTTDEKEKIPTNITSLPIVVDISNLLNQCTNQVVTAIYSKKRDASHDGATNSFNMVGQSTDEPSDGTDETEQTYNDVSSITSKRVSSTKDIDGEMVKLSETLGVLLPTIERILEKPYQSATQDEKDLITLYHEMLSKLDHINV